MKRWRLLALLANVNVAVAIIACVLTSSFAPLIAYAIVIPVLAFAMYADWRASKEEDNHIDKDDSS